jgi:anti-sigma28 factor (negative regulator of flagellin synthesis)
LVGENKVKGQVINSTRYENELVKLLKSAIEKGEEVEIEIV